MKRNSFLAASLFLSLVQFSCSNSSSSQGPAVEKRIIPQISIEESAYSYFRDTLGVSEAKAVFRNDLSGNLVYVLFKDDSVHSVEFISTLDVYHPAISPNGKWVAFGTNAEPIGLSSHVYIQALDSDDDSRMMIAENSAIPRWRVLPSGDTVLIYVSSTGVNRKDDFWNSQYTKMVPFKRGKLGTAKKIFTGNYHGGVSEDLRLAVTGSHFLRVHSELEGKSKDTIWYDSSQVCNVSLSTDGSMRTLFLDLAAKRGIEFSNEVYNGHHRILVVDSLGNLIESIPSPEPYSFDHPEWVYGSDFLLTAMRTSDVHEKVLLVDVRDSSAHPLVSGSDLWHPDVWLRK